MASSVFISARAAAGVNAQKAFPDALFNREIQLSSSVVIKFHFCAITS
jgi:hypothetical protein